MKLRDLSLRYKIPLRATVLMLITAVALTTAILTREFEELRKELFVNAETLGRVLSETLISPLRHEDLWRAYEIIQAPLFTEGPGADLLLLVDNDLSVQVSTQPENLRMGTPLATHGREFSQVAAEVLDLVIEPEPASRPDPIKMVQAEHYYLALPVLADGVTLGTLIMRYPRDIHGPRFVGNIQRAVGITLLVLALLLPLSWYWGQRMAQPLVGLASCMKKVGKDLPSEPDCRLYESRDEIGQLATQLRLMILELKEKQVLEQQMMTSERLAALGRLSAGMAHEINNPLGGMLNAISTQRKHGANDARTERTLALLERGLLQIRDTVSALLVEARPDQKNLSVADLEDVYRLLLPDVQKKQLDLQWRVEITSAQTVALPASLVRQILINLLLNAINAADPHGRVSCMAMIEQTELWLVVGNTGQHISPERMAHLFEPYTIGQTGPERHNRGHGLGLWITYQIVDQLNGKIDVQSKPGWTEMIVRLPVAHSPNLPRIEHA